MIDVLSAILLSVDGPQLVELRTIAQLGAGEIAVVEAASDELRLLPAAEIQARMAALPDWTTDGKTLFYDRTFADFVTAIAFVDALVEPAETLGHHPDIDIRFNEVHLSLTTHDAGGLTTLDFDLAERISQL